MASDVILSNFTRDIGHVLLKTPDLGDLGEIPAGEDRWMNSSDCISRQITASAVVMVGRKPGDSLSVATLWVIPGQPLAAIAVPVWVEAGCSPEALSNGTDAALWTESLRIKNLLWPYKERDKINYANLSKLDNASGTGFLPVLRRTENEIISLTEEFLKKKHSTAEFAAFQNQMAEKALETMRGIK